MSRDGSDIFAINAIHFNPHNTYVSAGGDGVLSFWDKEARHRLAHFENFKRQCPITDVKFSPMVRVSPWSCQSRDTLTYSHSLFLSLQGNLLFYSMSYDWSRGAENNDPKYGNNILVHLVQPVEVTPKKK